MDLGQSSLRKDEGEPSKLDIKSRPTVSNAKDFSGGSRWRRWLDDPKDTYGIKRRPTLSGAGDSERYDANAKSIKPTIMPRSASSKAALKELADLLSDLDTLDILGRRDGTEQFDDYSKASLKILEDSP